MRDISIQSRAKLYSEAFPNYPPLATTDRWIYGVWMIGNDYTTKSSYYGGYPPSYLRRVISMFPDADRTLHLFSGALSSPRTNEVMFDIRAELDPDIVGDAHCLSDYFEPLSFDLIVADPPYSVEDAVHYGPPMINRNKVVSECCKILVPGGYIAWLDQVLPMYSKELVSLVGTIGVVRSTNHRFRVLSIFKRV